VGICISTGWIVWLNGPYRCGTWSDEAIAQDGLHMILGEGERYIADGGYKSIYCLSPMDATTQYETVYMQMCRTRHETINSRFKKFSIISNIFKREAAKHGLYMYSIANIVQLGIMAGEMNPYDIFGWVQNEPETWPTSW